MYKIDIKFAKELEKFILINDNESKSSILTRLFENYRDGYAEKHPGGFFCIELISLNNGNSLSLHYWDKPYRESNIHNHDFDGISLIIFGGIINKIFNITKPDTSNKIKKIYKTKYANSKREYINNGNVSVHNKTTNLYKSDDIYFIDNSVFHSIESISKKSSTLFIRKNRKKESGSEIISEEEFEKTLPEYKLKKNDTKAIFQEVLNALS